MNSHQAKRAADVAVVRSDTDNIAEDTLAGADAIGRYFGKSRRQTFYLCEKKQIPAFKLCGTWHMRKSTYRRRIEKLEEQV
jgi:hypothetical protein